MTAALSPELAVAYVRELSADVQAVLVLDARGAVLAGDRVVAAPDGVAIVARTERHTVAAIVPDGRAAGPAALDAAAAAEALGGGPAGAPEVLESAPDWLSKALNDVIAPT